MTMGRSENEEDHSTHTICFVRDISLEKEMNQMKLEFISVASHELRTPLTSAKNAVDLIMAGKTGTINEKQAQFLSLAKRNIDRMVGLMSNLYDIYEIESGNMAFHFEKTDIKDCINSVVNALKPMADGKFLALNASITSGIPAVYADSHRIKEVILSLVGNAINFSPEKGRVTIEACEVVGAGGIVEISVTDSSIDILDELVVLGFEKLYQADSSLSAKDRADAGLSLAISRYTIEAHGGKLSWLSKKGEGNTFRFTLPVC
jgi:signal transduction histidine kinase